MITEKNIWNGFTRSEFACKCGCGFSAVDAELLLVLRDIREHFGSRVFITNACRCLAHNKKVGGAMPSEKSKGSKHVMGLAADISVEGIDQAEIATYLENKYPNKYGIGRYPKQRFTHVDVGSDYPRRWSK